MVLGHHSHATATAAADASATATSKLTLDPKYDDYDYPTTSPEVQSGHPGHTTEQQEAQVHQLRMVLESQGYTERLDTLTLLRFLRARKFHVDLAKQMFTECEKWHKEFGVDYLVRNFTYEEKAKVFEYYPQYYHNVDKDGRPVYIEQLGKIDLSAMYKITTGDRMLQNLVVEYEKFADPRLPACSRKAGRLLETSCTILDLKGVGLSNISSVYGYVKQASAISQNYYPERLGKLYLINAPWGFASVFGIIKGFLDPVTVSKIRVLGSGYQHEVLEQIPKANLPAQFGGSCHCPAGCMFSDVGPWQDPQWARPPKWQQQRSSASATATVAAGLQPTPTMPSAAQPAPVAAAHVIPPPQQPLGEGYPAAPAPAGM
ncbi:MAG: cytosolic factor, phosphatidylinositol/phosphatidylcholine transfer protein [Phylliscum demangeonii]|nr:MAG: cytosolic factor, phosphatidylinositol/phosphatidylcholine transfer protein [Phylliscum demangeonii]